jgi:uncharacterized protein YbjT (DUF2867 family)
VRIAVAGGTGAVGRHIVDAAAGGGHEVLVLARAAGVDLLTGTNLADTLRGVDAVIDVTSTATQSARASEQFFGTVTRNLLSAEEASGVGHHVALSIVGSDRAPFGYYAGKALQERLVSAGSIPWTILRATQFHEFAQQLHDRFTVGPLTVVPKMFSQPVAAREVADRLLVLAESAAVGRSDDLAGPEVLRMRDMVRDYAIATGRRGPILEIPLPGGFGTAMRDGTILPGPSVARGTQTFAEWTDQIRRG